MIGAMAIIDFKPAGRGPYALELAQIKPADRVLNVGCFNGALERHFLEGRCASYRGVDLNEEALAFAEAQAPEPGTFLKAAAEALPFDDASFDKVLCLDTLEHVNDEKKALAEIHRVLRPGGALVLSVPHDFLNFLDPDELTRGMRNFVRAYIRKKPLLDHPKHRHYDEKQLRELLNGFRVDVVHKSGTPVFWSLAMFYTAFGLPEKALRPLRKLTDPLENWDYSTRLSTGFNIMVRATRIP